MTCVALRAAGNKDKPDPAVPPPEETRSSRLTSLECSPRSDWTPPPFFGFVPVSNEEFAKTVSTFEFCSKVVSMVPTISFKSKGFGEVDPE